MGDLRVCVWMAGAADAKAMEAAGVKSVTVIEHNPKDDDRFVPVLGLPAPVEGLLMGWEGWLRSHMRVCVVFVLASGNMCVCVVFELVSGKICLFELASGRMCVCVCCIGVGVW